MKEKAAADIVDVVHQQKIILTQGDEVQGWRSGPSRVPAYRVRERKWHNSLEAYCAQLIDSS